MIKLKNNPHLGFFALVIKLTFLAYFLHLLGWGNKHESAIASLILIIIFLFYVLDLVLFHNAWNSDK